LLTGEVTPPQAAPIGFVPPLLPTLVDEPPAGDGWLHEITHDGYRTILVIDRGGARAFIRHGNDWTRRYRPIVSAAGWVPCRSAILDGEVVVQDEAGRSDYAALRDAIEGEPHRLIFFAFDLLHLNGRDLRAAPLIERREATGLRGSIFNSWRLVHDALGAGGLEFLLDYACVIVGIDLRKVVINLRKVGDIRSGIRLAQGIALCYRFSPELVALVRC
jgi:ATP dependent DNA ligase domain